MEKAIRRITLCLSMSFFMVKELQSLIILTFLFWRLETVRMSFSVRQVKNLIRRLAELGGTRLYPRFDCDLDYDEPAAEWLKGVIDSLSEAQGGSADASFESSSQKQHLKQVESVCIQEQIRLKRKYLRI